MKHTDIRYTPPYIIEPVRQVLGSIDLDPASSVEANRTIKATEIFTAEDNGLDQEWRGNVWLNWPASMAHRFANKLRREIEEGRVKKAAVMLFNWDHSTKWFETLRHLNPSYVLFADRIKFPGPVIDKDTGEPTGEWKNYEVGRCQAIAYIGTCTKYRVGPDVQRAYLDTPAYIIKI